MTTTCNDTATPKFPNRHLRNDETRSLAALLDNCGPSEVLRMIGQWVAIECEDGEDGDNLRSTLNAVALKLSRADRRP